MTTIKEDGDEADATRVSHRSQAAVLRAIRGVVFTWRKRRRKRIRESGGESRK